MFLGFDRISGHGHPETYCLFPGYLLLLIYSAVNLCDRSWGTREQSLGEDEGLWGWRVYFIQAWKMVMSSWCCVRCFLTRSGGEGAKGKGDAGVEEGGGTLKGKEEGVKAEEGGGAKGVCDVEGEARKAEDSTQGADIVHTESRELVHGLVMLVNLCLKNCFCELPSNPATVGLEDRNIEVASIVSGVD